MSTTAKESIKKIKIACCAKVILDPNSKFSLFNVVFLAWLRISKSDKFFTFLEPLPGGEFIL